MEVKGIEILIKRLQTGDEAAFQELFNQLYPALCLFAKKFVKDMDVAEDIVQDGFMKYWLKRKAFDNPYKLKSFLYLVVRNGCLNYIRNNRKIIGQSADELQLEADDYFVELLMEEEAYRVLYQTIDRLPKQMRTVIYHALDGLKNSEIAVKMQVTEHAVHASKKKAYKKLRECLKDHAFLIEFVAYILFYR